MPQKNAQARKGRHLSGLDVALPKRKQWDHSPKDRHQHVHRNGKAKRKYKGRKGSLCSYEWSENGSQTTRICTEKGRMVLTECTESTEGHCARFSRLLTRTFLTDYTDLQREEGLVIRATSSLNITPGSLNR